MNTRVETSGANATGPYREEVSLSDLWFVLWRYRLLVVGLAAAAGIVAYLVSWSRQPVYAAATKLVSASDRGDARPVNMARYQGIITDEKLILGALTDVRLTEAPYHLTAPEALQHNVSVQADGNSEVIVIATRLGDPALAAQLANRIAERSVRRVQEAAEEELVAVRTRIKVRLDHSASRLADAEARLLALRSEARLEALAAEVNALLQNRARSTGLPAETAKKLNELYTAQARVDHLDKEVELAREAFFEDSTRYEDARFEVDASFPPLRITDAAVPPAQPVSSRALRDAMVALLVAAVVAGVAVLLYSAASGKIPRAS